MFIAALQRCSEERLHEDATVNWIDKALGIHPQALSFRSERSGILASNIANADTPGYKARDLDFENTLKSIQEGEAPASSGLLLTSERHIASARSSSFGDLLYRVPTRGLQQGNSVETEVEQAAFADNALRYQASLEFLGNTFAGLHKALKGE